MSTGVIFFERRFTKPHSRARERSRLGSSRRVRASKQRRSSGEGDGSVVTCIPGLGRALDFCALTRVAHLTLGLRLNLGLGLRRLIRESFRR